MARLFDLILAVLMAIMAGIQVNNGDFGWATYSGLLSIGFFIMYGKEDG